MRELPRSDIDEEVWDRLADGELTRAAYQELLRSLDQRPDGWRRCALAFLEAQAWSQDLQAAQQGVKATAGGRSHETIDSPDSSASDPNVIRSAGKRFHSPHGSLLLAIAASFLVALGLGVVVRGPMSWSSADRQEPPVIQHERTQPASPRALDPRDDRSQDLAAASVMPAGRGNVRLIVNRGAGGEDESIDLPVVDLSPENAWLLSDQHPTVSAEVQRLFQRAGGQLRWERHLVPLQTLEGRQILVPLEQMEVTPVRGQRYQ